MTHQTYLNLIIVLKCCLKLWWVFAIVFGTLGITAWRERKKN